MNSVKHPIYVLDTSAWMTLLENESGVDTLRLLVEKGHDGAVSLAVSFVSMMEIYYVTMQEQTEQEAIQRLKLIQALPISIYESTPNIGTAAARIKAQYRVSFADAWIVALAQSLNATLVHKDPEFKPLATLIPMLELPYK